MNVLLDKHHLNFSQTDANKPSSNWNNSYSNISDEFYSEFLYNNANEENWTFLSPEMQEIIPSLPLGVTIFQMIIIVIVTPIGIFCNIIVIRMVATGSRMQSVSNIVIVNLAACDLLIDIFVAPILLWKQAVMFAPLPSWICGASSTISAMVQLSSYVTLFLIAAVRCWQYHFPYAELGRPQKLSVAILITLAWIIPFVWKINLYAQGLDLNPFHAWCLSSTAHLNNNIPIAWTVLYFLCFVAAMALYGCILCEVRMQRKAGKIYRRQRPRNYLNLGEGAKYKDKEKQHLKDAKRKIFLEKMERRILPHTRKRKRIALATFKTCLFIALISTCCDLPLIIMGLVLSVNEHHLQKFNYLSTALLMLCIRTTINPYMYALRSTPFRREISRYYLAFKTPNLAVQGPMVINTIS